MPFMHPTLDNITNVVKSLVFNCSKLPTLTRKYLETLKLLLIPELGLPDIYDTRNYPAYLSAKHFKIAYTEFFNFVIFFLNSQTQAKFDEQTQKKI